MDCKCMLLLLSHDGDKAASSHEMGAGKVEGNLRICHKQQAQISVCDQKLLICDFAILDCLAIACVSLRGGECWIL